MPLPDPNSYASIGWLMMAAAGASVVANQVYTFARNVGGKSSSREIGPQPLRVQGEPQFVLQADYAEFAKQNRDTHEALHTRIGAVDRDARLREDDLRENVQKRLDDLMRAVGRIEGKVGSRS